MLPDNRGIMKKEGKSMGGNFKRFFSLLIVFAMLMGCGIVRLKKKMQIYIETMNVKP